MIKKSLIVGLVALITCTFLMIGHHDQQVDEFFQWKKQFSVEIQPMDELYRRKIFE